MIDTREQAIRDVAEAIGEQVSTIEAILSDRTREISTSEERAAIRYAVAQREARLRVREALEDLTTSAGKPRGEQWITEDGFQRALAAYHNAVAALSAEKEG